MKNISFSSKNSKLRVITFWLPGLETFVAKLLYNSGVPKVNNALDEMDSNGIVVSSEQNQAPAFFPLFLLWSQFLSVERF